MSNIIWPTENDVGSTTGEGNTPTEEFLTRWKGNTKLSRLLAPTGSAKQIGQGGVVSGFGINASTATSLTLDPGVAIIRGYRAEEDTSLVGTLTASTFNFVFLALTKTSGLVTGLVITVVTGATFDTALSSVPDDSILLYVLETDGSSVINTYDLRVNPSDAMVGYYIGNSTSTRSFNLGFRPKQVKIQRFTEPRFIVYSEMPNERPSAAANFGHYIYERADGGGAKVAMSNQDRIRPLLTETGFFIDASTGDLAPGGVLEGSKTYDPPSINANTQATTTVTVTGAKVGDTVVVSHPTISATLLMMKAEVTAADTVTVYVLNHSTALINAGSDTLTAHVICQGGTSANGYLLNELNAVYNFLAWY